MDEYVQEFTSRGSKLVRVHEVKGRYVISVDGEVVDKRGDHSDQPKYVRRLIKQALEWIASRTPQH